MRERGLLVIERSDRDLRAVENTLSKRGRQVLAEATPSHVTFVRSAFLDALSREELVGMGKALDRVFDALIDHGSLPRPGEHA